MNFDSANLNLARKWRSKGFDQIVGQELSVKILKNSLYLNQFFPVYLFSGQRGCGKTSTARIFGAAVNCINLPEFQKNPKNFILPCLECASCKAMLSGCHPDFIEIDAASNTGVDNVRQIIESSSFMPILGRKKIYLVDEAHMLSKAAFNAFLKIMEEPPDSVIFILATTDSQKIIETVKSRSLQLFFGPIENKKLVIHLKTICDSEKIEYDNDGLAIIVEEAQGSVRDSINILEQVRFASGKVTKEAVQSALGHIDDESLIKLFDCLLNSGVKELLACIKTFDYELFSPQYLWRKIVGLTRDAIWIKHGITPDGLTVNYEKIKNIVSNVSFERLNYVMQVFYSNELFFSKTTQKHSLLEMIFMQISKKNDIISNRSGASSAPDSAITFGSQEFEELQEDDAQEDTVDDDSLQEFCKPASIAKEVVVQEMPLVGTRISESSFESEKDSWSAFLSLLETVSDPILHSIFTNGQVKSFDKLGFLLEIEFPKKFLFFQDSIKNAEEIWMPLLEQVYSKNIKLNYVFTGQDRAPEIKTSYAKANKDQATSAAGHEGDSSVKKDGTSSSKSAKNNYPDSYQEFKKKGVGQKNYGSSGYGAQNRGKSFGAKNNSGKKIDLSAGSAAIDVSNSDSWKNANMLLKYFSGSVVELKEK